MRHALLLLSFLGTTLFAGALLLSFVDPLLIERAAREAIRFEVERRVGGRIDELSSARLVELARQAAGRTDKELEAAKAALRAEIPQRVAAVMSNMLKHDCECRKRLADLATTARAERVVSLTQTKERLTNFAESAYASVALQLMREFRIFTGSNSVAFLLLGFVTYLRRTALLQLLLPAVVLVGAVAIAGSFYLLHQNWLHTILMGKYVGFAYSGYLLLVALFLADIVFNRAKVTTRLFNLAANVVGGAIKALPC
jgi:DNA-binding TFAR19-related protein (PDSD5 family)